MEHLNAAKEAYGRRLVLTDPGERADDQVRDMIEVLTRMRWSSGLPRSALASDFQHMS
jgi:predicted site-specific integrase-resolvase